jgi:osmoprotectant transport system permease protein
MLLSLGIAVGSVIVRAPVARLAAAVLGLGAICLGIGLSAGYLTPPDNTFARVSPSLGFWLLTLAFTLLLIDALARLNLSPMGRVSALLLGAAGFAFLLWSGAWDNLSLLKRQLLA